MQLSLGAALQCSPNSVQSSHLPQTHHLNRRHSHQSVSHITGQWGSCSNVTDVCQEIMVLQYKAHVLYLTYTQLPSYAVHTLRLKIVGFDSDSHFEPRNISLRFTLLQRNLFYILLAKEMNKTFRKPASQLLLSVKMTNDFANSIL